MGIHAIVFDFDGTLIDSNRLKYDAYFMLFPADDHHARTIRAVLSEVFEQSRYVILEEILMRLGIRGKNLLKREVGKLAEHYNEIVVAGAKTCPEKSGAEVVLKKLAPAYKLYVSSTTPDVQKMGGLFSRGVWISARKVRDTPEDHCIGKVEKRSGACGWRWGIRQKISYGKQVPVHSC